MVRPTSKYPTELELQILKILWRLGSASVRQVHEELAPLRNQAYTSVMTVMNIMTEKDYLTRLRQGSSFIYQARISETQTLDGMLGDLVKRAFDGSAATVMLHLLQTSDLEESELNRLNELINQKLKEES